MEKKLYKPLTTLLLWLLYIAGHAQQNQEELTTTSPYAYPGYQKAVVTMLFGSKKNLEANIYYGGSLFYYKDKDTTMVAELANVRTIEFDNGDIYETVGSQAAKLEAKESKGKLLSITTVDEKKMRGTSGTANDRKGENLPFVNIEGFGNIDLSGSYDEHKFEKFLLKVEYYFRVNGKTFPADYAHVKENVPQEKKRAFREKMKDRNWSWNDKNSLVQLLYYF
jgi:hypothetical protein